MDKKQNIRLIFLFLLVFFIFPGVVLVFSLDPEKRITQYMHDVWGIEAGLPQNTIEVVVQTSNGYLWLGTLEGLVRFDGVRFEVFDKSRVEQLLNNHIRALYEDREGNLWIGTRGGGLTCLNSKNGEFITYTEQNGLVGDRIRAITEDREGGLWIGTEGGAGGLNCFKDGKFTTYTSKQGLSHNIVRCICEDQEGNLWIGTDHGLNRLRYGKFVIYTSKQGLSHDIVNALYEDRNGNLWIGTNHGLNCLKDGKFKRITTKEGLSNDWITSICEDRDGNLWIGTVGGGVNRMKHGKFAAYTTKQGLSHNIISCICEDCEGSLWIGTWSAGLNRLKDGKFVTYGTKQGLSHDLVWSVYEDSQESLWIGTDHGLNRFKDGKFTTYTTKDGLSHDTVMSIREDRVGSLWIGTNGGGVNRLDLHKKDGKFTPYTTQQGLSNNDVWCIHEDREGSLWIGTWGGGVNRMKHGKFTSYTTKEGLSSDFLYSIYEDREGSLWIGTERGLNRLDLHKKDGTFTVFTKKQGLSNDIIRGIYEDLQGNLWIGTLDGGLNRLKDGKFSSITTKDGLFNDTVHQILEDDNGNFWMSCNKGIFMVNKKELDDFCEGRRNSIGCVSYDENDGMESRECNGISQPSGWKSRDGKLWFPTMRGVVMIDANNIKINQQPPFVLIEKITADNKSIQFPFSHLSRFPSGEKELVFPPGIEQLEIGYTGVSFLVPDRVRFKHKLAGFNKEWLEVGTRRAAYYTKLPPGKYTFRVMACNNDGIWNETGASISFYLKPFFYQTWWFYTICAFGAAFLALGIYRFRVRHLTRRKMELERAVAERTHQLEAFNQELEKLSIVVRETDNAVAIMDEKGNIQWVNEGFSRIYGYTLEQLIDERGRNIVEVSSNPEINEVFAGFLKEPQPISYEVFYQCRSGKKIWAQTTLTPIFEKSGKLARVVAIDTDITRLKESEQQIKEQHERILRQTRELETAFEIARNEREAAQTANQAKSEFLARMSHEIRTPMNGVIGFADMLMDTNLSEEQLNYVRTIRRSGEALISILNDILDLSKIEAGELSIIPIDFDPEVTVFDVFDIILPRISGKPVEMLCTIGNDVPAFVKGDAGRFRQVLLNLLGNAVKFTTNGEIELSLQVEEEKKDRIKFHACVRDTGIGIPAYKLKMIFDPFQQADGSTTREYEGTGLGLSISKQIARLMGGDVWADSTPGKGSTFHFTAWMEQSEKEPEKKKESVSDVMKGRKALVVDDNPTNLRILAHLLERYRMRVVRLTKSEDTVPTIKKSFTSGDPVDICIIDIYMPNISGYEVAQQIRQLESPMSQLPLLAYSSSAAFRSGNYKNAGFNGFLPKPVHGKKLVEVVARLLSETKLIKAEPPEPNKKQERELITRHTIAEEAKHSIHILLAEDNDINRKLAHFMLTKAGYRLTMVNNGKEAVETVISEPDAFDLIFMDVRMPHMDGIQATRLIREKGFKDIPIIAMTAQSMKGDREKCLEAGMNDYIAKPIKRDLVFTMVKKWCLEKVHQE